MNHFLTEEDPEEETTSFAHDYLLNRKRFKSDHEAKSEISEEPGVDEK